MKAWVLHEAGDIRYEEMDMPLLKENEVRVHIMAAGICGSDIPRIFDTGAHKMPLVPGHEFSGVVEGIGKAVNPRWLGKRVGVCPLLPCGICKCCEQGRFELCRSYDYFGSRCDGAFAEYICVPEKNLVELPDGVTFEEAAMIEPASVAVHAMRIGIGDIHHRLPLNAAVAVCGLGTIGLILTAFLVDAGYRNVYVIGNKTIQREMAAAFGIAIDHYCDSRKQDVVQWMNCQAGGMDAFFECVGSEECLKYGMSGLGPGGRMIVVGNPHGDMKLPKEIYWKLLRNQLTVNGTWNSAFNGDAEDDWRYVVNKLQTHRIAIGMLITHRYPLEQLKAGLAMMKNKEEEYCKVMVTV